MVNIGRPITAEIGWRVSGTQANFNGFRKWLKAQITLHQFRRDVANFLATNP